MHTFRFLSTIALLAGCASDGPRPPQVVGIKVPAAEQRPGWRTVATEGDRARLRDWREAWMEGLEKARAAGHGADIAREGALLDPDAALPWADMPPGDHRCRVIKVGAKSEGLLDYIPYPYFTCRVGAANGQPTFTKLTGSQRQVGLIFPHTARRMIFLGSLQLGDERRALDYGHDRDRDLIAVVERVGEQRWRMAFPRPHFESVIDIMEIVPLAG